MRRAGAFTLVELILVMALLCVILAIAVPSLSRSFHQGNLTQEATRLLAVTEYARDEAVSQGVPMVVWIDAQSGRFGAKPLAGYEFPGAQTKEFTLIEGLRFDATQSSAAPAAQTHATTSTSTASAPPPTPAARAAAADGETQAAEFTTDGTLDPSSQLSMRLVDRSNAAIEIAQTDDAWGYQIVKDAP